MSLTELSNIYLPAIDEELRRAVQLASSPGLEENYSMLSYHMGWDVESPSPKLMGKRIRPVMVLLVTEAGGGDYRNALPAAAAVELVHNFSLIHDDIQDQSPLRRGRPTVWKRWGIAQAINAGDAMFALAHLSVLRLNETTNLEVTLRASRLLQETCLELTQGQYLDLVHQTSTQYALDAYWPMIKGKTSALLSACAALGGMVAGVPEAQYLAYLRFAENIGLAFQVLDDILGIWGDDRQMGKSSESDLLTGKKSLPILFALSRGGEFSRRWAQGPIRPEQIPELINLLEAAGAKDYAQRQADELTERALEALKNAEPRGPAGEALEELASQLLLRSI